MSQSLRTQVPFIEAGAMVKLVRIGTEHSTRRPGAGLLLDSCQDVKQSGPTWIRARVRAMRATGGDLAAEVAKRTAILVLITDAVIGLFWMLGSPNRSNGPVYKPVRDLIPPWLPGDPARWWGGTILLLAVVTWLLMRYGSEVTTRSAFAVITAYWAGWFVAYFWGAVTEPRAGWAPIGYAAMCVIGNRRPAVSPQRVSTKAR